MHFINVKNLTIHNYEISYKKFRFKKIHLFIIIFFFLWGAELAHNSTTQITPLNSSVDQ